MINSSIGFGGWVGAEFTCIHFGGSRDTAKHTVDYILSRVCLRCS